MYKDMAFCHLQENLEINMIKKLMNTATKTGINAAEKFGDKYGKNLMDTAKKQGTNFAKTAGKKIVQKTCRSYWNKIADKITLLGKSKNKEKENETNEAEEIYIPLEKRQQIIDDLRLF